MWTVDPFVSKEIQWNRLQFPSRWINEKLQFSIQVNKFIPNFWIQRSNFCECAVTSNDSFCFCIQLSTQVMPNAIKSLRTKWKKETNWNWRIFSSSPNKNKRWKWFNCTTTGRTLLGSPFAPCATAFLCACKWMLRKKKKIINQISKSVRIFLHWMRLAAQKGDEGENEVIEEKKNELLNWLSDK